MNSASDDSRWKESREPSPRSRHLEFEDEALAHLDALYSFGLRLTGGDREAAEDLVQEAVLRAFRAWHQFKPGTNCKAWLMTILRNKFLSDLRGRERMPVATDELEAVAAYGDVDALRPPGPDELFFSRIVDDELFRAIDSLPVRYREIVILSDMQGLGYAEISTIIGAPVGTVKSRLFRGRRALQERLYRYAVENGYVRAKRTDDAA